MKSNDDEVVKIQGRLTATQSLWDNEREQILKALGITGDINVRSWTTETLIEEIKDCIEGQKLLAGDDIQKPGQRIDNVLELAPKDPELQRAWKTFPDPVADHHGFSWDYVATELLGEQWVHIFVHELHPTEYRTVFARVPARPGWSP
jgi:uncharacterized protein YpuA (DUF1002 family)